MNNSNLLISVITVSYNSEATIKDTIESILNQSYSTIEYIIIDGFSTDNTLEIIKSYEEKFKNKGIIYKWVSEKDKGIYDAMNKGILMSKGSIIGILNSDDWYSKNALEVIVKKKPENFTIITGKKNKVDSQKKLVRIVQNKKNIRKHIHKIMPINQPATFVDREVYNKIGLFDIQYKLSADYDLIYRSFNAGVKFLFTDEIIVNMRNTGATHQLRNLFITAKEDYHIRKKNNVKLAYFYYLKRLIFNLLLIVRATLKKIKV